MSTAELLGRLILGAILGGMVGYERELHGRPAGFRTNILVCLASVLIMILSEHYYVDMLGTESTSIRIDPARMAAGALTGVGFLGAGVILKSGTAVHGLTTAASIWIVAVIGLAVGSALYLEAVLATLLTMLVLTCLRLLERRMRKDIYREIVLVGQHCPDLEERVRPLFGHYPLKVISTDYDRDVTADHLTLRFLIHTRQEAVLRQLMEELSTQQGLLRVQLLRHL